MISISLDSQLKSILGGYYDIFLAKLSEKKSSENNQDNTLLIFSLYRKSLHSSLVQMFSNLDLFFGINKRNDYIENNLFNYILQGNEMIFLFIYNNSSQAIRIDYSIGDNIFAFKKYFYFKQYLGYYSSKLSPYKNPQFMQKSYVNTTIKYTS